MHRISSKLEEKKSFRKKTRTLEFKENSFTLARKENSDLKTGELFDRLKGVTTAELFEKGSTHHFECYKNITNPKTIEQI